MQERQFDEASLNSASHAPVQTPLNLVPELKLVAPVSPHQQIPTSQHVLALARQGERTSRAQREQTILQLQRLYGNRQTQRLLALARQRDALDDRASRPSGAAPSVEIQRVCMECDEKKKGEVQRKPLPNPSNSDFESKRISMEPTDCPSESTTGDVFALISDPAGGPGGFEDAGDQLGVEPLRMGNQTVMRTGAPDAGAAVGCAHPVNFTLGAAHDSGPDAIQVPISWDSSTGNLADLGNCTIREVVNYDAIPNPPFLWNPPNPTILSVPGSAGVAQDTHSYPPGLRAGITDPRAAGTMVAHQVYQFRCTGPGCSGGWEDLPGQNYTITRHVFPQYVRPNPWRYQITKTGVANGSREVEVPEP
jgi:hypothetical protein